MNNNIKDPNHIHGVLGVDYVQGRRVKRSLKYRLWRRTHEVREVIKSYCSSPESIIDLGAAEGSMLDMLSKSFPDARCVGVEYNPELVALSKEFFPDLDIRQGNVQNLDTFTYGEFDVAVATAIIEHLEYPNRFLIEVKKILRPGGILVMTVPDPFWEHIATMVGHLADEQHHEVPNLNRLRLWCEDAGLEVILARKFMLSPIGMPCEFLVENIVNKLGMGFMMANQLMVVRR